MLLILSSFLASAVEMVEALTIVLAAGLTRGWRSALAGVAAATLTLAVVVAILGPALTFVPLNTLRLVVGALLLVFGLQWLRKAILRTSGFKALHDEDAIFAEELRGARARRVTRALGSTGTASPCRSRGCSSRASRWRSSFSPSEALRDRSRWPLPVLPPRSSSSRSSACSRERRLRACPRTR